MSGAVVRIDGRAGRITLDRASALNALTYDMVLDIDAALQGWADDAAVDVVVIDAVGQKAFCAGGDIAELYATGRAGDFEHGRRFWRDEYRLNLRLASYPKPIVSLLQGYTMGGGVGIGCHGSDRVVGESSRIAMPEVGIGLVPDVGGSLMLARAPGALGPYLGLTTARMGPGDAILAGFADHFIPEASWPGLVALLCDTGDISLLRKAALPAPEPGLGPDLPAIDACFAAADLGGIVANLEARGDEWAERTLAALKRGSPLALACTVEMLGRLRADPRADMAAALGLEYRFTYRAMAKGDFLEGVRAAVIDKDRTPRWGHRLLGPVPDAEIKAMLDTLGPNELKLTRDAA
ncbi:enoyl-CoA hydratase/isomerase family protein (plasmid) [Rhodobacteraceae bacterium SC52]|nr:enoyl-CoA hydratase/isomerase family protein [Rhodobacteraceae bacterium SC52]